ncbi:hypothetical protein [Desertivirga xinjiangensis]|nr:hypothetical protein [Pedobacter xinjiangensis]
MKNKLLTLLLQSFFLQAENEWPESLGNSEKVVVSNTIMGQGSMIR